MPSQVRTQVVVRADAAFVLEEVGPKAVDDARRAGAQPSRVEQQLDEVVPLDSNTFYTQYGDWFVWFCMITAVVFILFAFVRPKAA